MKKKRTYRTEHVEMVRVSELLPLLVTGCIVALDVAKAKFVVALATWAGEVVKLLRFEHPKETRKFLSVVEALRLGLGSERVRVAMEPTGTYGDAIRHQLVEAGVSVHMVSPKKSHDSQELFDGVPSMHDPKSAALIARLSSMGLSRADTPLSDERRRLRALVDRRRHLSGRKEACLGRLEGLLARHWPEFQAWLDLREQRSAVKLLATFHSPAAVAAEPERARALLRESSHGRLSTEAINGVLDDAARSLGVPMLDEEMRLVETLAAETDETTRALVRLDDEIAEAGAGNEVFMRLAPWMGGYTAAVLVSMCDPTSYASARQLEKACGLNLREKSSGEHRGKLSITKRGPSLVRQVLYLFALRMLLASPLTHAWYAKRAGKESKTRAVVALMRKLVRAAFHVARGHAFDEHKLFDARRLDATTAPPKRPAKPEPRKTSRSIARGTKRGGAEATSAST